MGFYEMVDYRASTMAWNEQMWSHAVRHYHMIVACAGPHVVGVVAYSKSDHYANAIRVNKLVVDPAFQRQGIGKNLYAQVMRDLPRQQIPGGPVIDTLEFWVPESLVDPAEPRSPVPWFQRLSIPATELCPAKFPSLKFCNEREDGIRFSEKLS